MAKMNSLGKEKLVFNEKNVKGIPVGQPIVLCYSRQFFLN